MATLRTPNPPTFEERVLTEVVDFINLYFQHVSAHANVMLMEDKRTIIVSVQIHGTLDAASQADLKTHLRDLILPISLSIYFVTK